MRLGALLLLMLAACAQSGTPISGDSRNLGDLTVTFRVSPAKVKAGTNVRLALSIANNSGREVKLPFSSSQRFDFVARKDGREVWRWSSGMAFAQVLGEEVIAGQAGRHYEESFMAADRGTYQVQGLLTTSTFGKPLAGTLTVT